MQSTGPIVRQIDKKNLAIEALKKLINGDVQSQTKRNVMQSKLFSERLEAAIATSYRRGNWLSALALAGLSDTAERLWRNGG